MESVADVTKYLKEMQAFKEQMKFDKAMNAKNPAFDSVPEIKEYVIEKYFGGVKPIRPPKQP